jgi:RNA polymerase sigma-70 factor, ECF subfamily
MTTATQGITQLLFDWRSGNDSALEKLMRLVYGDLRRLAKCYLRGERQGHTLQTCALVNETCMRLLGQQETDWQDRAHFFAVAARIMRHVLVDHARARDYSKRNGGRRVTLKEWSAVAPERSCDLLALNESLERLAAVDPRKASVVELRYFAGLSVEETAAALGISDITVKREWLKAKAWLFRELSRQGNDDT